MPDRELTREEKLVNDFLSNPPNGGGALVILPVGSLVLLVGKAYTIGVRDERERREVVNPFKSVENRFDNLELKDPIDAL